MELIVTVPDKVVRIFHRTFRAVVYLQTILDDERAKRRSAHCTCSPFGLVSCARLPLVLPEVFDGQKSFEEWVSHFENVSAVNGWNDEDKLLWLKVRLTGKAHVAFAQLAHETQQSYATAKKALIDRFDPLSKQQLYKVEFEARAKRDKETWADFADELLRLASKAFPKLQEEAREELALSRYLDQIRDPQVSFAVKQRRPKSVRDAVSSTIELETYLLKSANTLSHVSVAAPLDTKEKEDVTSVAAIQSTQRDLLGMMQQLVQRVEQLELRPQRSNAGLRPAMPVPARSQPSQMRQIICYRCGQAGHFARGCARVAPTNTPG